MINSSAEGGSLERMLIISDGGPTVMPGMESGHGYARHPLEILEEVFQGLLSQPASILSARIISRPSTECYILLDGD